MTDAILTVSLKEYKKQIEDIKASMLSLKEGTAEYNAAANQAAAMQDKLNTVLRDSKTGIQENKNTLAGMRAELSAMKKEWANMEVGTKAWKEQQKAIKELNDKIGEAEQGAGNWSRNVGNYANSINNALGDITPTIKQINAGFKMLATNPFLAVGLAIVAVIKEMVDAFKRNSDAMEKVHKASARLSAVWTSVQRIFDRMVDKIVKGSSSITGVFDSIVNACMKAVDSIVVMWSKLPSWLGGGEDTLKKWNEFKSKWESDMNEITEINQNLATLQNKSAKERIANTVTIAKNEQKIAELQTVVNNRYGASLEERKKALKEIRDIETENLNLKIKEKENELAIVKLENSKTNSTNEDIQKEADLEAEIIRLKGQKSAADAQYYQQSKRLVSEEQSQISVLTGIYKKANKEQIQLEQEELKSRIKNYAEGSDEYLNAVRQFCETKATILQKDVQWEIAQQVTETEQLIAGYEGAGERLKEIQAEWSPKYNIIETGDVLIDEAATTSVMKEYLEDVLRYYNELRGASQTEAMITEANITELTNRIALIVAQSNEECAQLEIDNALRQKELADQEAKNRIEEARQNADILEYDEVDHLEAMLEYYRNYYDNLEQLQGESNASFKARQLAASNDVMEAERKVLQKRISNYTNLANGIGSLMSGIADAYEESINAEVEQNKISEEEAKEKFKSVKALQISVATIEMLTGVTAAISGLFTTKSGPWDIALAAIQAASIAASGTANIIKIANTEYGSTSAADTSSANSASNVYTAVSPILNEDKDMNNLNAYGNDNDNDKDYRVYILQSDLEASGTQVKIRQNQTTF